MRFVTSDGSKVFAAKITYPSRAFLTVTMNEFQRDKKNVIDRIRMSRQLVKVFRYRSRIGKLIMNY